MERKEFVRTIFKSAEWEGLLADGWVTICVNSQNVALMVKSS